jgi:1,4-dihydroxy-2-naphthoate octaprenyltransferase
MGNCCLRIHRTRNKDPSQCRAKKDQSLRFVKSSWEIFSLYFSFSAVCNFTQVIIVSDSAIAFGILYSSEEDNLGYVGLSGSVATNVFFTWGSWFISFSNFIPISLVVTV